MASPMRRLWPTVLVACGLLTLPGVAAAQQDESDEALDAVIEEALASEVVTIEDRELPEGRGSSYAITGDELRSLPGTGNDALKSLQSMPGVARVPYGGGGLVLRGMSPRDTNVVLDGIEVPILFHFGGLASFYPSALLEQIQLRPGSFGPEYGRAQGGLVTLDSKSGRTDRWRVGGEMSLLDTSLRADGPASDATTVSIGLRRSYVDAVLALAVPDDSELQLSVAPRYYDGQLRVDTLLTPRDVVSLMLFGADDRVTLGFDREPSFDGGPSGFSFDTRFVRLGGRWQRFSGDRTFTALAWIGADRSGLTVGDDGLARDNFSAAVRTDHKSEWDSGHYQIGLDVLGQRSDLAMNNEPPPMPGVAGTQDVMRDTSSVWADVGIWQELLWRTGREDWLAIRPGLRVDRFGLSDEWALDPRLSVSERISDRVTLVQAAGIYHQPPAPADADWGNPELRSSYAVQGELGAEVEITSGAEVSVTGFANRSERLPVDVVSSASAYSAGGSLQSGGAGAASAAFLEEQFGTWTYREGVGSGRGYGAELMARLGGQRAAGWLSYTFSRSLRRGDPRLDGNYYPFVLDQPHLLTALGSYQLGRDWQFGARLRYATGNPFTPVAGAYFDTDSQGYRPIDGPTLSARLPDFFQLDLRVDRRWQRSWGQISLFVDVQNVTNRANAEGIAYNYDYSQPQYTRGLPIFPSIGLELVQ